MEKRHWTRIAALGCLVCRRGATVHHVTSTRFGPIPLWAGPRKCHRRVVPLCEIHHQSVFDPKHSDPQSVEQLSHAGFYAKFGIDLFQVANDLWAESEELERRKAA